MLYSNSNPVSGKLRDLISAQEMNQQQIRAQRDQCLRHHPYTSLNASLERAPGVCADDSRIVARCVRAYRAAGGIQDKEYSTGYWAYIYDRQASNHQILLHGSFEEAAKVLRCPAVSYLFYGFDHISPEFTAAVDAAPERLPAIATLWQDYLIRLAEAVGAFRVENPEGDVPWLQHSGDSADQILDAIEARLQCKLSFPNIFPDEFGLQSSRGLVSYRAIQAVYQAYRIKTLLKGVPNPRVLEIGAGLGRSAYYARQLGIRDFTIIDLPLTSISQAYFLMRVCGEDAVQLRSESSNVSGAKIKIFDPSYFFADNTPYDLIVNCDSLTEVGRQAAEQYLSKISQLTRQFLSINHEANPFTISALVDAGRTLRFPYWMRPGYVEELVRFPG
jgi:hypothetical protein